MDCEYAERSLELSFAAADPKSGYAEGMDIRCGDLVGSTPTINSLDQCGSVWKSYTQEYQHRHMQKAGVQSKPLFPLCYVGIVL